MKICGRGTGLSSKGISSPWCRLWCSHRRGGPQARLARLLRNCRIEDFTESAARATGRALAASRTRDIVDAAVVVSALSRCDTVETSDPQHLRRIADAVGRRLDVRPV